MTEIGKKLPDKFIAISIVEDNTYLRTAWQSVLKAIDDFVVLGAYDSCEAALQAPDIGQSNVILMDIGLPGMSGIEGVKALRERFPELRIIMVTVHDDDQKVFDAICAGAVGYLLKATRPERLIEAIRETIAGGSPMTPNIARKVIAAFQRPTPGRDEKARALSEKEAEVLSYLSEGKSYRKIAEAMSLSIHGVRYHLRHIYEKLQVTSRSEAVARGLKDRLIRPPK